MSKIPMVVEWGFPVLAFIFSIVGLSLHSDDEVLASLVCVLITVVCIGFCVTVKSIVGEKVVSEKNDTDR